METVSKLWSNLYSRLGTIDPNNPTTNAVVRETMSPQRYANRAKDIAEYLSDGDTVLEIGCSYGGFAREIMKLVNVSYTVVENIEMFANIKANHGDTLECIAAGDIELLKGRKFNMFIAHYCLSETPPEYREYILKNIIKNCRNISVRDFEDAFEPREVHIKLGFPMLPAVTEKYIKKYFVITKVPDQLYRFNYTGTRKRGNVRTICFVTRCHPLRPKMRAICIDSVIHQSCNDYEHFLFHDDKTKKGYGRTKADMRIRNAKPLNGRYIMVLDDDDYLIDSEFVLDFKKAVGKSKPDVVIFKGLIGALGIMPPPAHWRKPPGKGQIGSFCFAVRKEFWDKYIKFWNAGVGDYNFISKCYENTKKVLWMDRLVANTQRISGGKGE